jgi:hypothetical protein
MWLGKSGLPKRALISVARARGRKRNMFAVKAPSSPSLPQQRFRTLHENSFWNKMPAEVVRREK